MNGNFGGLIVMIYKYSIYFILGQFKDCIVIMFLYIFLVFFGLFLEIYFKLNMLVISVVCCEFDSMNMNEE